jgi:S1-C subfamily serine protease
MVRLSRVIFISFAIVALNACSQRNPKTSLPPPPPAQTQRQAQVFTLPQSSADPLPALIDHVRGSVVDLAVMVQGDPFGQNIPQPPVISCRFDKGFCYVGTGFFVNEDYDIITAAHVSRAITQTIYDLAKINLKGIAVMLVDEPNVESYPTARYGNHTVRKINLTAEDKAIDLALFSLPNSQFLRAEIGVKSVEIDTTRVTDGDTVFECGYPGGAHELITTSGHIASAWDREVLTFTKENLIDNPIDVYRLDLIVNPGNSGGPLFRQDTQAVIGVIVEINGAPGGWIGTAVPSKYIASFLTQHNVSWQDFGVVVPK